MQKRLSEVSLGSYVLIKGFETDAIFLKLMEMGCIPGEIVKIDQVAPFGGPISITISGYHLSLRKDEAEMIFVEENYHENPI